MAFKGDSICALLLWVEQARLAKQGQRINIVSPGVLLESLSTYGDYFRGFLPVPAARVALAYAKSVDGLQTGQIYTVF